MTEKDGDHRRWSGVMGLGLPLLMELFVLLKGLGKAALVVGVMCW